ncbi:MULTISPECIES: prephenate dehydratase [Sphingopyxis]|jgi:prephenate dehydratase|uniref:prephenate dehydratase n=1 Tax=Sphingopyxis TaxID=165697 RepID=UPI00198F49BB|nr:MULTISPECIES: prephenate dehydratase [Sphingopyxis]MBD3746841.1 prephenate dehydratase [Sphingopyxis terrae]QXF13967.1 prephenate dehydratase [Sphingopyxis terrae subsp. terrae]
MGSYSASAQRLVDTMTAAALADPARGLAFQGAPGANSDLAAREFDPQALPLPCYSFEDAIEAVRDGRVDRAIIPIENSLHGRVADIHFLLPESGLSIVGEHFLRIRHGLMSRNLGPVTRAMSHEQALGQCRHWLRAHHISPIAHSDTAGAAAWVADSDEVGLAAVAPPHAADLYGLTLHESGIEDADHNMTRFVVLAREPLADLPVDVPRMTTFIFEVKNIPAALYKALGGFATNGVNMTKLESYQDGGSFAATKFYADIVGAPGEENIDRALEELDFQTKTLRLLGTYPQARVRG